MREFLSQKVRMRIISSDLVDWEAVYKMMDNSPQQFCFWVIKNVSKFCSTHKMLHRWGDAT